MSKPGRNDLCDCGSGRKFKKCCATNTAQQTQGRVLMLVVGGALLAAVAVGIASFSSEGSRSGVRVWDPAHGHYHNEAGVQVP